MEEGFAGLVPLLVFTAAVVLAAGIYAAGAGAVLSGHGDWPDMAAALWWGFALAAGGVLISLFHLGRAAGRSWLAVLGLGHSWLSREAILAGFFAAAAGATAFALSFSMDWFETALYTAAALGILTVVSIGFVYRLAGQEGWAGIQQLLAPLSTSLLFAAAILTGCVGAIWAAWAFWPLLAIDGLLATLRAWRKMASGRLAPRLFPALRRPTAYAHGVRLVAGTIAPIPLFILSPAVVPWLVAAAVALDRFAFYAGTAQASPSAEVARIKAERMRRAAQS